MLHWADRDMTMVKMDLKSIYSPRVFNIFTIGFLRCKIQLKIRIPNCLDFLLALSSWSNVQKVGFSGKALLLETSLDMTHIDQSRPRANRTSRVRFENIDDFKAMCVTRFTTLLLPSGFILTISFLVYSQMI